MAASARTYNNIMMCTSVDYNIIMVRYNITPVSIFNKPCTKSIGLIRNYFFITTNKGIWHK